MGSAILFLLYAFLGLLKWLIIISAIVSWLIAFDVINVRNPNIYRLTATLDRASTPLLAPIRRFIPPLGGLDLSPIIFFLLLQALTIALHATLDAPMCAALGCGGGAY